MTNKERRDKGFAYISDESIFEEQKECRKILQKLNFIDRSDFEGISRIVSELFGKSENAFVNPPFYCDYGKHIEVGKTFLPTITAPFWLWPGSGSVTTARWLPMLRSTPPATRFIPSAATQVTNTEKR